MKKKVLSVLLCVAMVATMAIGCGSDKEDKKSDSKSDDKKTEAKGDVNGDGKIICGYISKNIVDPFHAPINDYAKAVSYTHLTLPTNSLV